VAETTRKAQGLAEIPQRDGITYCHERDGIRLHKQHKRVLEVMEDGKEHTLAELALRTRDPEASVSARLRDLRKARFGSYDIQRRYVERGLYAYRLVKDWSL
jgi:DUF971 family protein